MPAILSAAVLTGAQAIHPGYGLLSENARFAELCAQCHIKFIGPSAEVIRRMGDKDEARRTMRAAGVPVVPGCDLVENVEAAARRGGKDRLSAADQGPLPAAAAAASAAWTAPRSWNTPSSPPPPRRESAFGDGAVYMEKLLENVKHVEVQLLCDAHGNVRHAWASANAPCSASTRSSSRKAPPRPWTRPCAARCSTPPPRAAKAVDYEGVGTVEFLLTKDRQFYFMEMNTRLQVEHPVTEMVTGIDLVKWQIRVAAGMELPFQQDDIQLCRPRHRVPHQRREPGGELPPLRRQGHASARAGRPVGAL